MDKLSELMRQTLVYTYREILAVRMTEYLHVSPNKELMTQVDEVLKQIHDILRMNGTYEKV